MKTMMKVLVGIKILEQEILKECLREWHGEQFKQGFLKMLSFQVISEIIVPLEMLIQLLKKEENTWLLVYLGHVGMAFLPY